MAITWLAPGDVGTGFPPIERCLADPPGLLAAGGDLSPARIVAAYRRGIFPWYSEGQPILWWCPDPRAVLFPGEFRRSRSLAKSERNAGFETRFDTAFGAVMDGCAAPRERAFFLKTARRMVGEQRAASIGETDFVVVIPAFTVSELSSAFQIGFLIFLPFLVIDLVVGNVLLAMGMMMMSPVTVSLPFKLLLFVLIDGWVKLVHGLVLSYH